MPFQLEHVRVIMLMSDIHSYGNVPSLCDDPPLFEHNKIRLDCAREECKEHICSGKGLVGIRPFCGTRTKCSVKLHSIINKIERIFLLDRYLRSLGLDIKRCNNEQSYYQIDLSLIDTYAMLYISHNYARTVTTQ